MSVSFKELCVVALPGPHLPSSGENVSSWALYHSLPSSPLPACGSRLIPLLLLLGLLLVVPHFPPLHSLFSFPPLSLSYLSLSIHLSPLSHSPTVLSTLSSPSLLSLSSLSLSIHLSPLSHSPTVKVHCTFI